MKCNDVIRSTEYYLWYDYVYYMDVTYVKDGKQFWLIEESRK